MSCGGKVGQLLEKIGYTNSHGTYRIRFYFHNGFEARKGEPETWNAYARAVRALRRCETAKSGLLSVLREHHCRSCCQCRPGMKCGRRVREVEWGRLPTPPGGRERGEHDFGAAEALSEIGAYLDRARSSRARDPFLLTHYLCGFVSSSSPMT